MTEIESYIINFAKKFDAFFINLLPKDKFSKRLHSAMNYSLTVGGKRLRPVFLVEISKIFGVSIKEHLDQQLLWSLFIVIH